MTQITLPWTAVDRAARRRYRVKAITLLLGLGGLLALFGPAMYGALDIGATGARMRDWRVAGAIVFVVGPFATGLALLAAGLAVVAYRQIGAFLRWGYVAAAVFFGGLIGVCLVVWLHAALFSFMKSSLADSAVNDPAQATTVVFESLRADLTAREILGALETAAPAFAAPIVAYLLWPLQFELVRDLLAMGGIIGFISVIPLFGIWWERKVAGRIQSRLGPMRVGGWHGWAQSVADGVKLIFKEDLIPQDGDRVLFRLAPYLTFVPAVCAFIALPFAGAWVFRDLDVALIFILAMLGIEVVGVILAGWASNNKWSVYGSMREACQMVSYEIPMGMSLLIPVMMAGTLQLSAIAEQQGDGFHSWFAWRNPFCFLAFFSYYTASLAACKRAPFDLPESESELVAGFHTEYSGFRWCLFFFAEYAAMFAVSGLAVILFLGGWKSPFPPAWAPQGDGFFALLIRGLFFEGPILFVLKAAFLYYVQLWVRWTLPRIRIDQVLYGCIQVLLPATMAILLGNTLWILCIEHWAPLATLDWVLHWCLVVIGYLMFAACFVIAAGGWINRRRLVGTLVIDHLPGA